MVKYSKEELEDLILNKKLSYVEIGKTCGISGGGVKKLALRYGIELPIRRKINEKETFGKGRTKYEKGNCIYCGKEFVKYPGKTNLFCSNSCRNKYKDQEYLNKWKKGEVDATTKGFTIYECVRRYIFEKNNNCCESCGKAYVNPYTNKSILQIHHKDGNCLNNKEENLQLLCPNCHAMTENFGSRNKNGNKERTKYYGKDKTRYNK